MGDIKAKDLNTAGSVAAGDKILGSSINGTTANVTVETLENHAVDTKTYTSLSDKTISGKFSDVDAFISRIKTANGVQQNIMVTQANSWAYSGLSLTVPANHIYIVWGEAGFNNSWARGLSLNRSSSSMDGIFSISEINEANRPVFKTPAIVLVGGSTCYLWSKYAETTSSTSEYTSIKYIDIV